MTNRTCDSPGCDRQHVARGLCGQHYQRAKLPALPPRPLADRFWEKVGKSDGCWQWLGSFKPNGYGQFSVNQRPAYAHRVAYEIVHGPIPDGLHVDHLCRNIACVNPAHLEPVTQAENNYRTRQKTCARGHALTGDNVRMRKVRGRQSRACRACDREGQRRRHQERKEAR